MFHYKEIVSCSAAVLALCVVLSHARPNQNEMLVKSASSLSQDSPSKLPGHGRNEVGEEVLEYYGGARGKFLVISPTGKMSIRGVSHPPGQARPDEEDVGVASEETDTITVDQPPASASVAEAKPIAVSVAGIGGTASAQPVATAIVGPGGLALTRPVATAIAGIKGVEGIASILGGKTSATSDSQGHPRPIYFVLNGQY